MLARGSCRSSDTQSPTGLDGEVTSDRARPSRVFRGVIAGLSLRLALNYVGQQVFTTGEGESRTFLYDHI